MQVPIANIQRILNKGAILQLIIAVTYKCNSKCITCNIWKLYNQDHELISKELTIEDIDKFCHDIDVKHLTDIYITGGEPYLRDDLSEMIGLIIKNNKKISVKIATNGMLPKRIAHITEDILQEFPNNDISVAVSIDGLDEVHDYIRGIKGAFKKACETISLLLYLKNDYPNLRVGISFTITENNYLQILPVRKFFFDIGITEFSCRPMHVSEHYYQLKEANLITDFDIIKTIEKQLNCMPKTVKSFFDHQIHKYLRSPKKLILPCYAGFHSAFIDPYGNVFPCMYYNFPLGNLKEKSFSNICKSDNMKTCRFNIKSGKCPNCWSECVSWLSIRLNFIRYCLWLINNYLLARILS
jgi:MoaA/NifB/PqqE/SkfB family radical SAM enzyme